MSKVVRRGTQQRNIIRQVVKEANRPLSPQEILIASQQFLPNLGIATIYRSVKFFTEDGIFKAVEVPGKSTCYEMAGKHHHHHFHCKNCGKVYEIDCCIGADTHNIPNGFTVDEHVVFLYGTCAECNRNTKKKLVRSPAECDCH